MDYYSHRFHSLNQFSLNGLGYDDRVVGKNLAHNKDRKIKIRREPI